MAKVGKFCCFFCPSKDYSEKPIDEFCKSCGRKFNFVLECQPAQIRDYKIVRSLGRGFYGSAYVAERAFGKKFVVKITPAEFYNYFKKPPFEQEADLHAKVAKNALHVVGINDAFTETVTFSDEPRSQLSCCVTVLDFVEGDLLKDVLDSETPLPAASVCQVAIDLIRLRSEFESAQLNHNDLHAENLIVQRIGPDFRRPDAIDPSLKVVAIDLGSIADASKSDATRKGDLAFIATHVDLLINRLLAKPDLVDDRDCRVALALQGIINGLRSDAQNVRLPNSDDLVEQIRGAFYRASHHWFPWRSPLSLKSFSDHYNAQTLESWNVPSLLVDPENRWLKEVTRPGPQIITGMRGCGKTMLLRALDIHARATQLNGEQPSDITQRIKADRFVGLFASAQRLLDLREQALLKIEYRLTRLFVAYCLQAVRALIHVKDVAFDAVASHAHSKMSAVVADYLQGGEHLRESFSLEDLENRLLRLLVLTVGGSDQYVVKQAPGEVFAHLAEQFTGCSELFQNSTVLFLLDDVSTRYLDLDKVESLLSALLFQAPKCAFKFTSEWQTIELGLRSPGRVHPIRIDRDLTVFDLGADVFEIINTPGNAGKDFIAKILMQRAKILSSHPKQRDPKVILGDVSLEQVAKEIASANETSGLKKRVYRGLSCLTNVCVGDLGDVIKLYENILRSAGSEAAYPISAEIQSRCFQDLSSHRLFDLSRRADYFKNHAIAYADAAHDLLVRSYRIGTENSTQIRLRQFSSIYIRITGSDELTKSAQIDQLRQLIDSGVFVFSGGAPRLKTKDSNPTQQFILSYRKIYGLASYIGLADRDRFELSGQDLKEWLENHGNAKAILLRNQIRDELISQPPQAPEVLDSGTEDKATSAVNVVARLATSFSQRDLFDIPEKAAEQVPAKFMAERLALGIRELNSDELLKLSVGSVFTGLGFEDRTLASNVFLSKYLNPERVFAIKYSVPGHAEKIMAAWSGRRIPVDLHNYQEALISLPTSAGLGLVDVSGLAKPLIFKCVRSELLAKGQVLICHAQALQHYPLEEDLSRLFAAQTLEDGRVFLESLDQVLRGEKGPYTAIKLLGDQSDPSRARALLAFASAKHERLFSLLDRREYDQINVITPSGDTPRAKVATFAAEYACQNHQNAQVTKIDSNDLAGLIRFLDNEYLEIYDNQGANLELGLTGSKMQGVAAAVLSTVRKVSQAWYLSPREFDERRFSTGVGAIRVFEITINGNAAGMHKAHNVQ